MLTAGVTGASGGGGEAGAGIVFGGGLGAGAEKLGPTREDLSKAPLAGRTAGAGLGAGDSGIVADTLVSGTGTVVPTPTGLSEDTAGGFEVVEPAFAPLVLGSDVR